MSEEASYWWSIGLLIQLVKQYGWDRVMADMQEVDPTIFLEVDGE